MKDITEFFNSEINEKLNSNDFSGSQYLIDYSYEDDDRNVYTMNAKDIWNEIHIK